ncbi:MAG TPA: amidohydrolase family protein [Candidatus Binatia bacterium]|nr:amidohydrolase family protein [Candidatus Binatia bacterium]
MRTEEMILVSVDDHVVEPRNMFDQHLASDWKPKAPRVVRKADGSDVWVFAGEQIPNIGLNAVVGRPREEYGMEPTSFDQLRKGTYDIHERVRDMNVNGVLASLCFPSFPGLCGALFFRQPDKQLALTMLRAYNDWHIDEWCDTYPGRFIPLSLSPFWDPQLMADEVRRVAKKGCRAVTFTESPDAHGLPSFHNRHWDPFWKACSDEGTVVCIHIGSGSGMKFSSMDAPVDVMITVQPIACVNCAADLLWSRVLKEFPHLRIAMSEGGIGWIPYFLERADYVHDRHHCWTHQDFGGKRPSEIWRQHVITCFIDDPVGISNRHGVGIDTITWECDYPHSDTTWPKSPEALARCFEGVSDEDVNKITHQNALRFFGNDPFKHRPKSRCTVGALRAESPDVDLSVKSQGGKPPVAGARRPVTTQDVLAQLASVYSSQPE